MANKNSAFRNFTSFSRTMNNVAATTDAFDPTKLVSDMTSEHAAFVAATEGYDKWASSTMLSEAVNADFFANNHIAPVAFKDLFALEDDGQGHNVVVFNPNGMNGASWSKNDSGFVNAFLTAFGTCRYNSTLTFHLHERKFDPSMVISHNVRTAYDETKAQYVRFDWNTRRWTQNTPYFKTSEGAGWLSKHVEIDRLILALIGGQVIRYTFFNEYAWNRFQMNVLDNMNSLISKINVQLANQAESATVLRKVERNNVIDGTWTDAKVASTAIVVDGTDLKKMTGTIKVEIKMRYAQKSAVRPVTVDAKGLAFIAATMNDKDCEYVHLVQ